MEINRENYFDLLWANYTKLIGEGYLEKPIEWTFLFSEESSNSYAEKYREVNGLPMWAENHEGQAYNRAERSLGNEAIIVNRRFDQSVTVTWEYFSDNKEKVMGGQGINGDAKGLGRGCRVAQEVEASKIINNGFAGGLIGYDGVTLFSTAHPLAEGKGTASNTTDVAGDKQLTDANLKKAVTAMRGQVDNTGIKIQVNPDRLAVSADLYFQALTIVNSALQAGTNNNDKNVISMVAPLTVKCMSYFDNGIWVLKDSSIDNLIFQWRERPEYGYERIPNTADFMYWGRCRFGVGYRDWRGLYGVKVA